MQFHQFSYFHHDYCCCCLDWTILYTTNWSMRHQWSRAPLRDHFVYRLSVHLYVRPSVNFLFADNFQTVNRSKTSLYSAHKRFHKQSAKVDLDLWPCCPKWLRILSLPTTYIWSLKGKSRKYLGMFRVHSPVKIRQVWDKDWSQQVKHVQVPKLDRTRCPKEWASHVVMPNPSQMPYENLS